MEAVQQMGFALTLCFTFQLLTVLQTPMTWPLSRVQKRAGESELLEWPVNGDDPCVLHLGLTPICAGSRIQQICYGKCSHFDGNPLNATTGWSLPNELQNSAQLTNLTLMNCNLAGSLPEFLGNMSSLDVLLLSKNRLSDYSGTFKDSELKMLWLNDQSGDGMSGSIDIVSTMGSLTSLWLHGNHFSGKIPKEIGNLTYLQDLNVNSNDLVGLIPESLANMPLGHLDLNNNRLRGPIPEFKATNASYGESNSLSNQNSTFCAPEVMALRILDELNYPSKLVESWSGDNPCDGRVVD
ncbi:hypothetical protein HAX54_027448 [Datura stramonium]|uniref:Uncharacterized protein n=1 Tax=Datura stramonium TaxID=4076 RepID=A0ABS8S8R7_DATST|nr:hypothetical protein [Datura stramonium]